MKRLLFLSLSVLCWPVLIGQQSGDAQSMAICDSLKAAEDFKEAIVCYQPQLEKALTAKNWTQYAKIVIEIADSEMFLADETAEAQNAVPNYDKARSIYSAAIRKLDKLGLKNSPETADIWMWLALSFAFQDRFSEALEAYNEAISRYEACRFNGPNLAFCYKNATQVFIRRSDFRQAHEYLKAAVRSDTTGKRLLSVYNQMANNYLWQDSLDKAIHFFEKGQSIKPKEQNFESADNALIGGTLYAMKPDTKIARRLVLEALPYFLNDSDGLDNVLRCYTLLADISFKEGKTKDAAHYFQTGWKLGLSSYKVKSREMAKLYVEWAGLMRKLGRRQEALNICQKALIQSVPGFNLADLTTNPEPNEAPLEVQAMNAAAEKAAALLLNPTLADRENAAQCFNFAFAVAEQLRRAYGDDETKLYQARTNYNLKKEAALNLWQLYRISGNQMYLQQLFAFLETNRANTLRDALQQQRAFALAGLPDSLLQLEENIRKDLAADQNDRDRITDPRDSLKRKAAEARVFKLERSYHELLSNLYKQYPQFNKFASAGQIADVQSITNSIPDTTALFTWFDAGDRYLCLRLYQGELKGYEIFRNNVFDQETSNFIALLQDKNAQERDPQAYFELAYKIRRQLLPDEWINRVGALILVPDGLLNYIPFEALLNDSYSGSYANAPYLLKSHTVQYIWSATMLTEDRNSARAAHGFIQLAPFVTTSRDGLAILPNSMQERPAGINLKALESGDAGTDNFFKYAPDYAIVHLATHAHAGQQAEPGIELYDRTMKVSEIYAYRLKADLVTLSACETGTGKFAAGEGVLSLSRAFAYTGVQSVVASLWSVNERSTADLFASFYKAIATGDSKAVALRAAKLDLLRSKGMDAKKAPYYWAAFTLSGQNGTIDMPHSKNTWYTVIVTALVLMLALSLWLNMRRKRLV